MSTKWDWSPLLNSVMQVVQQGQEQARYNQLLNTFASPQGPQPHPGPQLGGLLGKLFGPRDAQQQQPSPFGQQAGATPPPMARTEDDSGMPIPGRAPGANIQTAQGGAPQQSPMGGTNPQFMDILRKLPPQIGMPLLMQTMQQQMMPGKAAEPVKVGKGERLIDPRTGKPIYEPPAEDGDPFTLNEGDRRYNAKGELIIDNPKAPPAPTKTQAERNAEALGYAPGSKEWSDYIREATLPRAPQTTINNNMGNSLASGVGGGAADILKESRASAAGALPSIETGNRILQALDSGKVITGPGASFRLFGAQLFGDPETLQQTRTVIQGLADATLNARGELKGQGQITEYEQKTLEKARSGNIDDLTAQEIRTIVRVNDRLARTRIRNHKTTLSNIKGADVPENFLQIYNVDEPPEYQAQGAGGLPAGWTVKVK